MKKTLLHLLLPAILICSVQSAQTQTLDFINLADMPTPRGGSSATTTLSHEYVANGFTGGSLYTSQIERYSFADNTWSTFETSVPSIAKCYGNGEQLINRLYLYNGTTASGLNDKLEIIDLNTGELTVNGTPNPNPVYNAGSGTYFENLLSFGGCISAWDGTYSNKLYKISLSGQWTPLADMPEAFETKGIVSDGNTGQPQLYVFGGYREEVGLRENFQTLAVGDLALPNWVNVAESGTKLFQGKFFGTNKYAQMSAFTNIVASQEASNKAWLVSPNISLASSEDTFLNFDTLDGYDNGATLQVYLVTNWTGDILTSDKVLLNAVISSGHTTGYGTSFINSGNVSLAGAPNNFRIAFKYTGGYEPLATTTFQIDNVRVYQGVKSNKIYVYDFISNTWSTAAATLPFGISAHAVTVDKLMDMGKIYVSGDYENQTFLGVYDLWTGNFTTLGQTNMIGRRHHTSEIIDNKLYLFGGNTTSDLFSSLSSTQSAELPNMATTSFGNRPQVNFYPNPAQDKINLTAGLDSILLTTFEGKSIRVWVKNNQADISVLAKGVYLIQGVREDGSRFSEKLIKN